MSFTIIPEGTHLLARIVAGEPVKINTMYVVYGPGTGCISNVDLSYLRNLQQSSTHGYARVPITISDAQEDGTVDFYATVTPQDLIGAIPSSNVSVLTATLAYSKDGNMDNDILLGTCGMSHTIPVTPNNYISIKTSIRIHA